MNEIHFQTSSPYASAKSSHKFFKDVKVLYKNQVVNVAVYSWEMNKAKVSVDGEAFEGPAKVATRSYQCQKKLKAGICEFNSKIVTKDHTHHITSYSIYRWWQLRCKSRKTALAYI